MTVESKPDAQDQSEYNAQATTAVADEEHLADTLKTWAKAAGIRAVKTAAQAAVSIIPISAVTIGGVDWIMVLGAAALAGVISLITSLAGIPEAADGSSIRQIINQ